MDDEVIDLLSDDEDSKEIPKKDVSNDSNEKTAVKRPSTETVSIEDSPEKKIRRIQPVKIGEVASKAVTSEPSTSAPASSKVETNPDEPAETTELDTSLEKPENGGTITREVVRNELSEQLMAFIKACRMAEPSGDMKKIIKTKLLRYYHSVHPKYIASKGFLSLLDETTAEILKHPHHVYSKLKLVIDELDTRRRAVYIQVPSFSTLRIPESAEIIDETEEKAPKEQTEEAPKEDEAKTGNKEKDAQLKKLYQALRKAKRIIEDLESEEVDWDDDVDSAYLKKVRYEKRACEIYQKICDITGESSHAHRLVKKPIVFKETNYPDFNKRLQKMVNRTNAFPNFRDVLKLLDFCNKKYKYHMSQEHQTVIARDAFTALGKLLQERRKADLYETATFYTGKNKDPAKSNKELRVQLEKNKTNYSKIDDLINAYTLKKERDDDEEEADDQNASQKITESNLDESLQLQSLDESNNEIPNQVSDDKNASSALNNNDDDDLIMLS